jgi:hypothetical protein
LRKILALSAAIAVLCAAAASAAPQRELTAPLSLADFAYRYSIGVTDEGRVYRVHITSDIFRGLRQTYERDLAVFDSDANPVPFIVRDIKTPYDARDEPAHEDPVKTAVPLFPLPPADGPSTSMMDVTIRTDKDGQIIEIGKNGSETSGGGKGGGGRFLADLSKIRIPPDGRPVIGYKIEIPAGDEEDAAAFTDVYASDNLRDWRQVARREPLIHLRRGDDLVSSGVIEINSSGPVKYLMLEVDGTLTLPGDIFISAAAGESAREIQPDSEPFTGVPDGESRSLIYDTGGIFPASEVNFILESPGIYMASVSSRNDADDEWRNHGDIRLSFIKNNAGDNRNAPISIRRTNNRFWRLTPRDRLPSQPLSMRMYWHPKELVFVAQGRPPYVLAFGSDKDSPGLAKPDLMRIALDGAGEHDILETEVSADIIPSLADRTVIRESGDTETGIPWAKYVVWAVLVGGALLLSCIAWSLIQKGKTDSGKN